MKKFCVDCGEPCTGTRCRQCYNANRPKTKRGTVVTCTWCGKEFRKGRSGVVENNFCNRECYLAWRSAYPKAQYKHSEKIPRIIVKCAQCDKEVERKPRFVKERNFCSHKCHNTWLSERREERIAREKQTLNYCARCEEKIRPKSTYCRPCAAYLNTPTRSIGDDPKWWERQLKIIRETRSRGEDHYNWRGGVSQEPYGEEFDNELREKIRERDNRECQLCGKLEIDNGEDLSVHHIDYSKQNHDPNNLISLCRVCHSITNHDREKWKSHLQKMTKGSQ